jgi:acetyl esterase/lipase
MAMRRIFTLLLLTHFTATPLLAADAEKQKPKSWPPLEGATQHLYQETGEVKLSLHAYYPLQWKASDQRAAIVFFFGGGWVGGNPVQFKPQCEYLASRGMVAMSAEYRIKRRHGTTPFECVADGKAAIRWVRQHAAQLGIDPNRIVASGGSAGGQVAACTAVLLGPDETTASAPNALVLFNPAVDTTETGLRRSAERFGECARELSPVHHVREGIVPTLIFHGTDDTAVPIETVRRFRDVMHQAGNRCELVEFAGKKHGFFNFKRDRQAYSATMRQTDHFLQSLGYLVGEATIGE